MNGKIQRLGKWEVRILECVRTESRTEKKIAKMIGLDGSIIYPMITDLMLSGHMEMVTKRKLYFFFRKLCALTPDGLAALEEARSPWDGAIMELRNKVAEIIEGARGQSPALNATWHVASAGYKVAKFVLSR